MAYDIARTSTTRPAPARRAAGILVVIGGAGAAGVAALARAHTAATADTHSSEGLLLAAAWWVAAALFAWLIATAGAATVARAAGAWRTATWLDVVTVPVVRTLLDRVLVLTVVASAVVPFTAHAAGAAQPRRPSVEQVAAAPLVRRHTTPHVRRHAVPAVRRHAQPLVRRHVQGPQPLAPPPIVRGATTTTSVATRPAPTTPVTAPAPKAPPATQAPRGAPASGVASVHVVVRDDNLWVIAAARLERAGGPADDVAIARYWRRVISRNQARLRSGDPNLIFPGEVIWLPPVDRAG